MDISEDVIEAVKNEYAEILSMIGPAVTIERLKAPEGSLCLWKFTVRVRTYYISGTGDSNPKPTDQIVFYMDVRVGYPRESPKVYYEPGKILASINTFTTGSQCIDHWYFDENYAGKNTTLAGTVRKTLMDIIHEPAVSRYDSPAHSALISWQRQMTESGKLPSARLDRVLKTGKDEAKSTIPPALPEMPKKKIVTPPNLPGDYRKA